MKQSSILYYTIKGGEKRKHNDSDRQQMSWETSTKQMAVMYEEKDFAMETTWRMLFGRIYEVFYIKKNPNFNDCVITWKAYKHNNN